MLVMRKQEKEEKCGWMTWLFLPLSIIMPPKVTLKVAAPASPPPPLGATYESTQLRKALGVETESVSIDQDHSMVESFKQVKPFVDISALR
jgi:hypothetical protein